MPVSEFISAQMPPLAICFNFSLSAVNLNCRCYILVEIQYKCVVGKGSMEFYLILSIHSMRELAYKYSLISPKEVLSFNRYTAHSHIHLFSLVSCNPDKSVCRVSRNIALFTVLYQQFLPY